jgi:hypothetical protein
MADRKKRSSSSSSRKTVRKASAGYTLEADDTEPAEPERRKTHKEEVVGQDAAKAADPDPQPEAAKASKPTPATDADTSTGTSTDTDAETATGTGPEPEPEPPPAARPVEHEHELDHENHGYASLLPPEEITPGDPEADAPAPGPAPPGDSRSFRRRSRGVEEFFLIYRSGNHLISRSGVIGKNGTWRVVEYPNIGSAAHAYAQECSELTGRGFRDLPRPAE